MRMSPENNVMHHIKQSVFTLAKSSAFLHFFFLTRLQSAGRPLYTFSPTAQANGVFSLE